DTFAVMDQLRALGREVWFQLGDRDLAWCIERRRLEDEGATATAALRALNASIGVRADVLPMTDAAAQTEVNGRPLQEFLIRGRGEGPVSSVVLGSAPGRPGPARPTPEVLAALAGAQAIVIGPSNPVISIWPILMVAGEALGRSPAPVVAVSPLVGGEVLKGPTAAFLDAYGLPTSAAGVASFYASTAGVELDGMLADEPPGPGAPGGISWRTCDVLMDGASGRARVAAEALAFATSLARPA
ncbi:MAG: YvcK family protein, partial [Acidobacteriota bacterium]|nr:YvcK family protein [Acidobacteriota bacterium]